MSIVQTFYDNMATHYHKLFSHWESTGREQAALLSRLFREQGFDITARVLDCACGIGTQAIGLAALGYRVIGSDISAAELAEAKNNAAKGNVAISFTQADFCALSDTFTEKFPIILAMDNALPHMLTPEDLERAIQSITGQLEEGGIFVASIRDYDALLAQKPAYAPPYIHNTPAGKRVSFQTWDWEGDCYRLTQYIIEDEDALQIHKFDCLYRATTRQEITRQLLSHGCRSVNWLFPEQTGFYQPILVAKK